MEPKKDEKRMVQGSFVFYTEDIRKSREEIEGWIFQLFSENVGIANFPTPVDANKLKYTSLDYNCHHLVLNEQEERLTKAWNFNHKNPQFSQGPPITKSGRIPPNTSLHMTGKIAIGLVIVSGQSHEHTPEEEDKILQQVLKATDFLANVELRARITFMYKLYFLKIKVDHGVSDNIRGKCEFEKLESPWRDAALRVLGQDPGNEGISKLTDQIIKDSGSDWGYVAFFTKYEIRHYAYTRLKHLVMQYKNGEWGPDYIHLIFAHETCHIFGGKDEYGEHDGEPSGILQIPNGNAKKEEAEICLMQGGNLCKLQLCKYTRGQIGWFWGWKEHVGKELHYENINRVYENTTEVTNTSNDQRRNSYSAMHEGYEKGRISSEGSPSMIEIELTCRLYHEIEENSVPFPIKVSTNASIYSFTKIVFEEIKRKNNEISSINADDLKLWKVEIDNEKKDEFLSLSLKDEDEIEDKNVKLVVINPVSEYWKEQPERNYTQVIVHSPLLISNRYVQKLIKQKANMANMDLNGENNSAEAYQNRRRAFTRV